MRAATSIRSPTHTQPRIQRRIHTKHLKQLTEIHAKMHTPSRRAPDGVGIARIAIVNALGGRTQGDDARVIELTVGVLRTAAGHWHILATGGL